MIDIDLRAQLVVLYGEPQRHYHNLSHILHCLREMDELVDSDHRPESIHWMALEYAIWFHDAVYDPKAPHCKNEKDSSELAHRYLWNRFRQLDPVLPGMVAEMIEESAWHTTTKLDHITAQAFFDIDLSVLGHDFLAYHDYATGIRKEYAWVPGDTYVEHRTAILNKFLSLPRLYRLDHFYKKYERTARSNIQWELSNLPSLV